MKILKMRATFGKLQSAELALGEGLVVSPPLGVSLLVQAARAKTRARDRTSARILRDFFNVIYLPFKQITPVRYRQNLRSSLGFTVSL